MSDRVIKTRIQLRRDNESAFEQIKNTFVPLKGEVLLVDTSSDGLRAKVGDGSSSFAALAYTDENIINQIKSTVIRGYYYNGSFYKDPAHSIAYAGYPHKLYIDIPESKIYSYDTTDGYSAVGGDIPRATDTVFGVVKLYATIGSNTDGTMTQAAITSEINKKFEVEAGTDETLNFVNYNS